MNAGRKKTKKNLKTHQVVPTPRDSLRGKAIDKRSMVTSPGQGALIEQKNQIDGGKKSHGGCDGVYFPTVFTVTQGVHTE